MYDPTYENLDEFDPAVDKTSGGSTVRTLTYYPVAGAPLAPGASAGVRIDSTLYYILKDHLGSASVVTDAGGNVVGEQRYYPFGEARLTIGTLYTDRLFTGQREMAGLGVYHYGARFYSPKLARFLSADTIVPGYANPQNLNRYSYVNNSPLMYTDPTGHSMDSGCNRDYGCGGTDTDAGTHEPDDPSDNGGGGGGGGGGGKPEDNPKKQDDPPICSPNVPNCDPIFSGTVDAWELDQMSTNLDNTQSMLDGVAFLFGAVGIVALAAAGVLAITPGVNVVGAGVIIGLTVVGSIYGLAGIAAAYESNQVGKLKETVDAMKSKADASPTKTVDVYVSTAVGYRSPAANLDYGSGKIYVANSLVTNYFLHTSFSK